MLHIEVQKITFRRLLMRKIGLGVPRATRATWYLRCTGWWRVGDGQRRILYIIIYLYYIYYNIYNIKIKSQHF